jgi:hydrogenase expression/formation protein HypD
MPIKHLEEYRDSELSRGLVQKIKNVSQTKVRLMEVCGTHTVSIFRAGIRSVLPDTIELLSGPGCPVCVTDQRDIDGFIELSGMDDVIITTFGDLMRVPGTRSSLEKERAEGRDIRIVYSTMDAIDVAVKNADKKIVFLGVGFETTGPTIAAAILSAKQMKLDNFSVYSAHKLVPPALGALMSMAAVKIDGFILPGHVSVIIGQRAYQSFFEKYQVPCVIAGFEPADILQAILMLTQQLETGAPNLENAYSRAVTLAGNRKAQKILLDVFEPADVSWRGLGTIPQSGLKILENFREYDAEALFGIDPPRSQDPLGCACGQILIGAKIPPQCRLYKKVCTAIDPVGTCMVSSEGDCAAYYRYHSESAVI